MKVINKLLLITTLCYSFSAIASNDNDEGEYLYKSHCASCHGANVGQMDLTKRVAPPIAAVRMHYIGDHPDETSFVNAVSQWVAHRDPSISLMRGAIRRFDIMPAVDVSEYDTRKIAAYIYSGDLEEPEGFEDHVREEHKNKKGKGKKHNY